VVSHLLPESGHTEWSTDISQRHDADAAASGQEEQQ